MVQGVLGSGEARTFEWDGGLDFEPTGILYEIDSCIIHSGGKEKDLAAGEFNIDFCGCIRDDALAIQDDPDGRAVVGNVLAVSFRHSDFFNTKVVAIAESADGCESAGDM